MATRSSRADPGRMISAIVRIAGDHSALSDELHFAAHTPAEFAHLGHGRANVLRALRIPSGARVLEIGAEFGALTRYLGEQAAVVHAFEPDAESARTTAARTAGLDNVTVFEDLGELPADARYDLAVVSERYATPRVLAVVRVRLAAGGAVAVAVDDLSGRREVETALDHVDLRTALVLTCTPGHRAARAVLTRELTREHPRLAAALTTGEDLGFLLLAGEGAYELWPYERLATYFNTAERAAFACTRADVVRTDEGAEVRRTPLTALTSEVIGGISVQSCVDRVFDAPTMLEVLRDEPWRAAELLTGWRELLREEAPRVGAGLWDLVPHNVLVGNADGVVLRPIDLEWRHTGAGVPEVLERGVLVLADQLTAPGWRGAGAGSTMREVAGWLGVLLGLDPSFVDAAVEREVDFATIGSCGAAHGTAGIRAAIAEIWARRLERRADVPEPAESAEPVRPAPDPGYPSPGNPAASEPEKATR